MFLVTTVGAVLIQTPFKTMFYTAKFFKMIFAQHFVVANYRSVSTVLKKVTATKFFIKSHEHAMIHGKHF